MQMIIFTVAYSISALLIAWLAVFVYIKGPKKVTNVMYSLVSLGVIMWLLGEIIATNTDSYLLSYWIHFALNANDVLLVTFFVHWSTTLVIEYKINKKRILLTFYSLAILLLLIITIEPSSFIISVVPKMYLPFVPVPGVTYLAMFAFFLVGAVYGLYLQYKEYNLSNSVRKNLLKYTILGSIIGFFSGLLAFPIVWGVEFDPLWASSAGIYAVIISYAIVRHKLMDIELVIKRTFLYTTIVVILSSLIFLITYANNWFVASFTWSKAWMVPLLSASMIVILAYFIWKKLESSEKVKYDFLTIAAHRFRTPLTRTKHGVELLISEISQAQNSRSIELAKDHALLLERLKSDNEELINLTSLMLDSTRNFDLKKNINKKFALEDVIRQVITLNQQNFEDKKIRLHIENMEPSIIIGDEGKIRTLVEILIENALHYNYKNGNVLISLKSSGKSIECSITNTGLSLSEYDKKHLFDSFYRSEEAKKMYTEGVGLGLFFAKKIVGLHEGEIKVSCNKKNTTFIVNLPGATPL